MYCDYFLDFLPPKPLETQIQQFQLLVPTVQKGFTIRNCYYMLSEIIFGQWLEKSAKKSATNSGLKSLVKTVSISVVASTRFITPFYLESDIWIRQASKTLGKKTPSCNRYSKDISSWANAAHWESGCPICPKRGHKSQLRWLPRWAFQAAFSTLEVWATCQ